MNKPAHWTGQFGLQKNPFRDTIDTDLFFRTRQHEDAALKIKIGIEDHHALVLLTGVSGTGKTLASQVVLRSLAKDRFESCFVFVFPGMGKGALLGAIVTELGLSPVRFVHDRLRQIQEKAMELYNEGKRLVIVIDEAHFLKADALHVLRTLSNLETEHEKLVTVLLIAEQGIRRRLQAPSYASLRGRITFSVDLLPLSINDLEQYVKYRILKCGGQFDFFPTEIYAQVHELSGGIPREINRLLYAGLIEAIASNQKITLEILASTAQKLKV